MPTQMGRIAVPFTSFRTTIGMLVTGSINRPRIFISTSLAAGCTAPDAVMLLVRSILCAPFPVTLVYTFPCEGVGSRSRHSNVDVAGDQRGLFFAGRGRAQEVQG